jgi:hypothetical protein
MKQLLILTIFLSPLFMASVTHAEWTKVSENMSGHTFYVDLSRIEKHNGKIYY